MSGTRRGQWNDEKYLIETIVKDKCRIFGNKSIKISSKY